MLPFPSLPADHRAGLRRIPGATPWAGQTARAVLPTVLEALLLALLAALLGRPRSITPSRPTFDPAFHPGTPGPTRGPVPLHAPSASDGTHLVIESPILYVLGPGPGIGLRPHPRAIPDPRPRIARAPPAPPLRPTSRTAAPSDLPSHRIAGGGAQPWALA